MSDDRPLETQTAAPPLVPPRRPRIGAAMMDDAWFEESDRRARQLVALIEQLDVVIAAHQAARARLDEPAT